MRGGKDEKEIQEGTYSYGECQGCRAKLHINARRCLECGTNLIDKYTSGEWQQELYISHNPEDAIYSTPMNKVEKCMTCIIVTRRGVVCPLKYCFATAKGRCENCQKFDSTIFCCCQEVQKEEGAVTSEDLKKLKEGLKRPMARALAATINQFDDDIPF
jgi:hypothetical protein